MAKSETGYRGCPVVTGSPGFPLRSESLGGETTPSWLFQPLKWLSRKQGIGGTSSNWFSRFPPTSKSLGGETKSDLVVSTSEMAKSEKG